MSSEARRAYLSALLQDRDAPTAILCAHGYLLANVTQDLLAIDAGVFDRTSLASMDDYAPFDIEPYFAVGATLPSKQMGRAAVELLQEAVAGPDRLRARHVVLPIELREGSRAPRAGSQLTAGRS
jgi:LacI family transcriptional regulator